MKEYEHKESVKLWAKKLFNDALLRYSKSGNKEPLIIQNMRDLKTEIKQLEEEHRERRANAT